MLPMRRNHRFATGLTTLLFTALLTATPSDIPLMNAVQEGDSQLISILLRDGENPNAVSADGTSALHWAAYRNDSTAVELLLEAGATVGVPNRYDVTPLSLAAARAYSGVVRQLLEAGADNDAQEHDGETAIKAASEKVTMV